MNVLIISCSHNPQSKSAVLAKHAMTAFSDRDARVELVDLRELDLPLCDGGAAYGHADVQTLTEAGNAADVILLAVPVYNFYANAAAKNVIELAGRSWTGKLVGFACAAGGHGSYMSVMSLANSLMLDFRCMIVPRFVYATKEGFTEQGGVTDAIGQRIEELCDELLRVGRALAAANAEAGQQPRASQSL